jgi:hypothetical protein
MALKSDLLRGNARLEQAAQQPPSIKPRPAVEDADAVARIQMALIALGYFPADVTAKVLAGNGRGIYGPATTRAVADFQRAAFPHQPREWDGRCGRHTLTHLDARLIASGARPPVPAAAPAPPREPITATHVDDQAFVYPFTVVDPMSVAQYDTRTRAPTALRYTHIEAPIRCLMFDVRHEGKKYWVGAAIPAGLTTFSSAHVFFHPAPHQAGLPDARYDAFDSGWKDVERYVPWLGSQLAAAKREQVLLVPYMTEAYFNSLGLLATDPLARIGELLAAVQGAIAPQSGPSAGLTRLAASSFSVGVTCLAKFSAAVSGSRLLTEAYDFDGLYSNSKEKFLASVPGAAFRKYSQAEFHTGMPGFYCVPMSRWRHHVPQPTTGDETHGMMPDLFYHAASATML